MSGNKGVFVLIAVAIAILAALLLKGLNSGMSEPATPFDSSSPELPIEVPTSAADIQRKEPLEPDRNAAIQYNELYEMWGHEGAQWAITIAGLLNLATDPTVEEVETVEKGLDNYQRELSLLEAAATKPDCDFERDYRLGLDLLIQEPQAVLHSAKLLASRARLAISQGSRDEFFEDLDRLMTIATHIDADQGETNHIVAMRIRELAVLALLDACWNREDDHSFWIGFDRFAVDVPPPTSLDQLIGYSAVASLETLRMFSEDSAVLAGPDRQLAVSASLIERFVAEATQTWNYAYARSRIEPENTDVFADLNDELNQQYFGMILRSLSPDVAESIADELITVVQFHRNIATKHWLLTSALQHAKLVVFGRQQGDSGVEAIEHPPFAQSARVNRLERGFEIVCSYVVDGTKYTGRITFNVGEPTEIEITG